VHEIGIIITYLIQNSWVELLVNLGRVHHFHLRTRSQASSYLYTFYSTFFISTNPAPSISLSSEISFRKMCLGCSRFPSKPPGAVKRHQLADHTYKCTHL
jgi:hypothetical protein